MKRRTLTPETRDALLEAAWRLVVARGQVDASIADAIKQGGTVTSLAPAKRKSMVDAIAVKWKGEVDSACGADLANQVRTLFGKYAI